jgi:peptide deformylase
MIHPIILFGNPLLRKKSETLQPSYPGLGKLIADMFETMYESDGIGLAAPQIGLNIRLFVIDASALSEDNPELEGFKKTFINAEILEKSGELWAFNEGCLSLPEIREEVKREQCVTIKYSDENFAEHTETYSGIKARIIMHEYDHIEGKLFIDHVSPIRRRLLGSRLSAIEKGRVRPGYPVKVYKK